MATDCAKCLLSKNFFSPESEIISEKGKKNFFVESLDQFRRLEVREKAGNVFVMSLPLSSV